MTIASSSRRGAAAAAWIALVAAAPAQTPPAPATKPEPPAARPVEWPALKATDKDRVLALVGQFRKPDAALHEQARAQLVAIGAGAAPLLMQQVSDRDDVANAHVLEVLDAITTREHAPLLARETKKPRTALRRYLTERLCRFGDASLLPVFATLQQDSDAHTAFCARLALLAAGRKEALPEVLAHTKANWPEVAPLLADVLAPVRSAPMGLMVFEAITKAPSPDQANGLRLLRHLMVKEQGMLLRSYLEASDHGVKREAINTARVVHGEPALDKLSVFQAIEMAKEWAQKL